MVPQYAFALPLMRYHYEYHTVSLTHHYTDMPAATTPPHSTEPRPALLTTPRGSSDNDAPPELINGAHQARKRPAEGRERTPTADCGGTRATAVTFVPLRLVSSD